MKRKSLLFLLLMALFAPWAAQAQETVTIGEGTGTTYYFPIDNYFNYSCTQQIYTAEEIGIAGTIEAVSFYYNYGTAYTTSNVTMYMKNVDRSDFSSTSDCEALAPGDIVWTGSIAPTEAGWYTFTLDTPFEYDGTSNLLVAFFDGTRGYPGTSYTWRQTTSPNSANMALRYYSDSACPDPYNLSSYSGSKATYTYRTNIQIEITPAGGATCPKPDELTANGNPTATEFSFTITGGSGLYNIFTKAGNDDWTNWEYEWDQTTVDLTGLTPATDYQVRVQSVCTDMTDPETGDAATSGWKTLSFTTACEVITTFPWSEDFESYAAGNFNNPCWVNEHISGNGTQIFKVYTSTSGTNSTHQLQLPDMSNGTMTKLRLPEMTLASSDSYLFSIDVYRNTSGSSYTSEGVRVFASTDGEIEGATELGFLYRNCNQTDGGVVTAETATGWYTYEFPIPFTGTCYIVLRGENQYGSSTYMDNFKVKKELPCVKPANPTFVSSTTTSATLSWTNGAEGQTAWQIAYSTDASFNPDEVTPVDVTSNPATIDGLTPSTIYYAYVRANCGDLGYSEWSTAYCQFATACEAITTFPWSYDFENDAAGDFANPCWVNEHIEGSSTYVFYVYTSTMGGNSTHQLQLRDQSAGNMTKLVLPEMTLPGDNYQFVIDVYRSHYSTLKEGEGIRVFASTDGEIEGATELAFIPRQYTVGNDIIPAETVVGWYTYELPIGISGTCYIILRGESQYGTSTYMDNFAVMQAPTCMKPTNLTQTHTNHSATLSWTAGNEGQNAWQIAYSTTSFNPNAADFDLTTVEVIDNVDETSYTFDKSLDANTHYYMYVRGYCGDEDYSKWVGIDFTTGTANPSPTVTTVDEITPVSAVLRWTAAGGDYLESYDIYYSQTSGEPANDSLIQYTGVDAGFTSKILENLTEGYWYVYMRAYHGETDGYSSWTPYYGYGFQVPEACPEPTGLAASDPTPNSITLTWTEGAEWQYAWKVAYSTDPEFNPEEMDPETFVDVFGQQGPTITCTVNGLESETTYYFKVLGNCNSPYGDSDWTDAVSETTLVACPVPTDLNVTVAQTSATLNWTGYSDSYTVQYRTAGGYDVELVEGFESGSMPAGWTIEGDNQVSTTTWQVGVGDYNSTTGTHDGNYNALIKHTSDGDETYLITPALDFSGVSEASLNLWYINRSWAGDTDEFGVYYRVNGGEWNELFSTTEAHSTWTELNLTLTGLAANTQIGFKCYDNYGYGIGLDDITILGGEYNEPGEWIAIENVEDETITIEGLEFGTKYDAQVKANCGDEYCDYITFTTNALKRFTTEGAWEVADNWTPAGAPTIDDVVSIEAPATISQIAYADVITVANGGSITIADGGQLQHNNAGVTATVKKTINGYTVDNYETNNGYYFIANPTTASVYPEEAGLITDDNNDYYTYDLYDWAPTFSEEWRNYRDGEFSTLSYNNTPAYLYANMNTVELAFTGTVRPSQNRVSTTVYVSNYQFGAWNLIGNPLVCNAYLVDNNGNALPYYRMNEAGNGFDAVTGEAIAPVTGIFYEAPAYGQVYFTREAPANGDKGVLNMNLRSNNKQLDNAIVRFGEGQQMSKFSFRENSTKVYIPMDGIDYAVVNAGQAGEMPVSFKAESNGSYSLNFTSQEVSFSYLHLIDNMTGNDVNLLETPSYSFEAKTTDYANRFRLVFATGNSMDGESFSFVNAAGNLCIFGIEGEATVQVVDAMGRVLSSETFSGSYEKSINAAPGVYMIRLINGNDVKVQKIVVR